MRPLRLEIASPLFHSFIKENGIKLNGARLMLKGKQPSDISKYQPQLPRIKDISLGMI
jgi:hypothetical protein